MPSKQQKIDLHSLQGDKAIRCQWSPSRNARTRARALECGPPTYHDQI